VVRDARGARYMTKGCAATVVFCGLPVLCHGFCGSKAAGYDV
jgi:hypothetical protein